MSYSDIKIKFIKTMRDEGRYEWSNIATNFNQQFEENKSANAIRKIYYRYKDVDISEDIVIKSVEQSRRASNENRKLRKIQNILVDKQLALQDVITTIESLVGSIKTSKYKVPKIKVNPKKKKMVIEPLISDIHYGLKTKSYNSDIARDRVRKVTKVALEELHRYSKNYSIDMFNILLNGDLIQSATMHKNSHAACDLTNAQQIAVAIESIFYDLILPIALTGHRVNIIATCGNHDRIESERFTINPGIHYMTFTIYKALELLCVQSNLTNVTFTIPNDGFYVYNILGSYFLVEHGDCIGKADLKKLEAHINKRSVQTGKMIQGIRIGHFHNDIVGNLGRYVVNGSPVSDDHYGTYLGFKSRPCQIINYYVETNRETSYYHSLVVDLNE